MVNIEAALGPGHIAVAVPGAVRTGAGAVHMTELVHIEVAPGPGPGDNTVAVPGAVRTGAVRTVAAVLEVVRTGGDIPEAAHTGWAVRKVHIGDFLGAAHKLGEK